MIDRPHAIRAGFLLLLTLVLYFFMLGRVPFHGTGEAREALEVQEEITRGEWILPLRNGIELPSKPPLFHWLGGLTALAVGRIDEWTVRIPSAVLATVTVFAIYWFAARRWGAATGLYAACVLATSFEWMRAARGARVDMTLNACLAGAFIAFGLIADSARPTRTGVLSFALCMGLATLAKGPLGLAVPALAAVAYLFLAGNLRRWREFHPILLATVAVGVPACWYAAATWHGGEAFVRKQILVENLQTFFAWTSDPGTPKHSFLYFIPALFTGFMPWSPLLLFAGGFLYAKRRQLAAAGLLYPVVWFVAVFLFFTVAAGKRSVYMLPAYPAAAVLVGWWWQQLTTGAVRLSPRLSRAVHIGAALLIVTLLLAFAAVLAEAVGAAPLEVLRPFLHHKDQANLAVVHQMIQARASGFLCWALAGVAAVSMFALALQRRRWHAVFAAVVFFAGITSLLVNGILDPELAALWTPKPFVAAVRAATKDGGDLGFYETFDYAAVFYWGDRIPVVQHSIEQLGSDGRPRYLLLWESRWKQLSVADRERLDIMLRGSESGSDEGDRLLLARVKADA